MVLELSAHVRIFCNIPNHFGFFPYHVTGHSCSQSYTQTELRQKSISDASVEKSIKKSIEDADASIEKIALLSTTFVFSK